MDWEQIQQLQQSIQIAIAEGMRDGFAAKEAEPVVTVNVPPLISMRDFFAGCALIGYSTQGEGTGAIEGDAAAAYKAADVMLQARGADHA